MNTSIPTIRVKNEIVYTHIISAFKVYEYARNNSIHLPIRSLVNFIMNGDKSEYYWKVSALEGVMEVMEYRKLMANVVSYIVDSTKVTEY